MSEIKHTPIQLNTCPICGCFARFEYGGAMDSGKRIVKVRCDIGCVEQVIFYCEETDAAKAWNFRATTPEYRDLLDALQYALPYLEACVPNPRNGVNSDFSVDMNCVDRARAAIAKARGVE
jgi:hypothetical protein